MNAFTWLRRSPRLAVAIAVVGVAAVAAAVAFAATGPAIQTSTPHFAGQITNIDVLRQQIKNYYGDPLGTGVFEPDSNYARGGGSRRRRGWTLARRARPRAVQVGHEGDRPRRGRHHAGHLELRDLQQLGLQPDDERDFVTGKMFPAVPGMVDMVTRGRGRGIRDHLDHGPARLAGGGDAREPDHGATSATRRPRPFPTATLGGGPTASSRSRPSPTTRRTCRPRAPTRSRPASRARPIHYKSATRGYIESLGYEIVANFGDQFSDFTGGFGTARSRCRTQTTSCRRRGRRCKNRRYAAPRNGRATWVVVAGLRRLAGAEAALGVALGEARTRGGDAAHGRCVACAGAARRVVGRALVGGAAGRGSPRRADGGGGGRRRGTA